MRPAVQRLAQIVPNAAFGERLDGVVSIIKALRVDDKTICGDFGIEQLTAMGPKGAIIHDKLVVIDPNSDN